MIASLLDCVPVLDLIKSALPRAMHTIHYPLSTIHYRRTINIALCSHSLPAERPRAGLCERRARDRRCDPVGVGRVAQRLRRTRHLQLRHRLLRQLLRKPGLVDAGALVRSVVCVLARGEERRQTTW